MNFIRPFIFIILTLLFIPPQAFAESKKIFSETISIDRVYESMTGPTVNAHLVIDPEGEPELVWINKVKISFVDGDSFKRKISPEYLCHASLNLSLKQTNVNERNATFFNHMSNVNQKLVDLVQGITELELPKGFGIPIYSNESLWFHAMVFNPSMDEDPFKLKAKMVVDYTRDKDADNMRALFRRGIKISVPIDEDQFKGSHRHNSKVVERLHRKKKAGKTDSYHWLVPPGRHIYSSKLTEEFKVPFTTTIHFMTVHLHPYAEYLKLKDLETGEIIFKSEVKNMKERLGIDLVDSFSSKKGIVFHPGHEYELSTAYNNTTDHSIDAMAVMYLYFLDKKFDKNALQ